MRKVLLLLAVMLVWGTDSAVAQTPMKFFVTSTVGPDATGSRGIRAPDEHCELLGYGAGYGDFQWRAFLDAPAAGDTPAVKAIDRIGNGPWHNYEGALIAESRDALSSGAHNLDRQTAIDELGSRVYASQNSPSPADLIKSGAPDPDGRYFCFAI